MMVRPSLRMPREYLADQYVATPDPWGFVTSGYERQKYDLALAAIGDRHHNAIEIGCSVGVFTAMLAPRCEHLVAVDFSPTALERARERLGDADNVELLCRRLPEEMPDGPFDTIVCAEVLYYWSAALVRDGMHKMEAALAPGGTLLAVHWRQADPRRELTGDDVHAILDEETSLRLDASRTAPEYLLDRWRANE